MVFVLVEVRGMLGERRKLRYIRGTSYLLGAVEVGSSWEVAPRRWRYLRGMMHRQPTYMCSRAAERSRYL
jgi:hypothetical protein